MPLIYLLKVSSSLSSLQPRSVARPDKNKHLGRLAVFSKSKHLQPSKVHRHIWSTEADLRFGTVHHPGDLGHKRNAGAETHQMASQGTDFSHISMIYTCTSIQRSSGCQDDSGDQMAPKGARRLICRVTPKKTCVSSKLINFLPQASCHILPNERHTSRLDYQILQEFFMVYFLLSILEDSRVYLAAMGNF